MKVSREQKQAQQGKLISAFVRLVQAKSYTEVSLRDVGREVGVSDGAIYKYFSSKEKILLAYYAEKMHNLVSEGHVLSSKSDFTVTEKIQALLEFQIGQYEKEKDFLKKTFHPTFVAASLMWSEVGAMRKAYLQTVRIFLDQAVAKGEFPEPVWTTIVDEILWCHYMGVMLYWQKDESENHEDTTQFIDRTLNFFSALVGGPLLKQAEELVGFLINRHVLPLFMNFGKAGMGMGWQGMWGMGMQGNQGVWNCHDNGKKDMDKAKPEARKSPLKSPPKKSAVRKKG